MMLLKQGIIKKSVNCGGNDVHVICLSVYVEAFLFSFTYVYVDEFSTFSMLYFI